MNKLQQQLENNHKRELENSIKRSNYVCSLYSVCDTFFIFLLLRFSYADASKCEKELLSHMLALLYILLL